MPRGGDEIYQEAYDRGWNKGWRARGRGDARKIKRECAVCLGTGRLHTIAEPKGGKCERCSFAIRSVRGMGNL